MKNHSLPQHKGIYEALYSADGHSYQKCNYPSCNSFYIITPIYSSLQSSCDCGACWTINLHWWWRIWLHQVEWVTHTNALTTISDHWKIVHKLQLAQMVHWRITPITFICSMGMVILLDSCYFLVLCSFSTSLHSPWHLICGQAPVQAKYFWVVGHCGKDKTSPQVAIVGHTCSSLLSSQEIAYQLQMHLKCLQESQETIQSFCQHDPALPQHDLLPTCQRDPPFPSGWNNSGCHQICRKLMLQALQT